GAAKALENRRRLSEHFFPLLPSQSPNYWTECSFLLAEMERLRRLCGPRRLLRQIGGMCGLCGRLQPPRPADPDAPPSPRPRATRRREDAGSRPAPRSEEHTSELQSHL